MKNLLLILSALLFLSSCATTTNREKILFTMAGAAAGAALIGASKAPENENRAAHALQWAGVGGAIGGVFGLYHYDSEYEVNKKDQEIKQLRMELSEARKIFDPKVVEEGPSVFNSNLPSDVKHLLSPGKWRRYELDQWVQSPGSKNIWYRQTEMFEVIPPKIGGIK